MKKILSSLLITLIAVFICSTGALADVTNSIASGTTYIDQNYESATVITNVPGDTYYTVSNGDDISELTIPTSGTTWILLQSNEGNALISGALTIPTGSKVNLIIGDTEGNYFISLQDQLTVNGTLNVYGQTKEPTMSFLTISKPVNNTNGTINLYSGQFQVQNPYVDYLISGGSINVYNGFLSLQGSSNTDNGYVVTTAALDSNTTLKVTGGYVYAYTQGYIQQLIPLGVNSNTSISGNCVVAGTDLTSKIVDNGVFINSGDINYGYSEPTLPNQYSNPAYFELGYVKGNVSTDWAGNNSNVKFGKLVVLQGSTLEVTNGQILDIDEMENDGDVILRDGSITDVDDISGDGNIYAEPEAEGNLPKDENTIPVPSDFTPAPWIENDDFSGNTVKAFTLSGGPLQFFSTTNASEQSQNFNVTIYSSPNRYSKTPGDPNITWTIYQTLTTPTGTTYNEVANFNSAAWNYKTINTTATDIQTGVATLYSIDKNWAITFDYSYTPTQDNLTGSVTYSNVQLHYNGADPDLKEGGIYFLNARYDGGEQNIYDSSVTVIINGTDVKEVYIQSPAGNILNSTYNVNFDVMSNVQFRYQALNANYQDTTGKVVKWQITSANIIDPTEPRVASNYYNYFYPGQTNPAPVSNYASINETTGQLTVFRAIPQGQYLYLWLTVDGVTATNQPILLDITGTSSTTSLTGLGVYDQNIYISNRGRVINADQVEYDLTRNVYALPRDINVILNTGDLVFTSSNPELPVINGNTIVSPYTGYIGSTVITATLPGTDYSTTFNVNVTAPVPATGITSVANELYFNFGSNAIQNVNLVLDPVNSTLYEPDHVTYTTSNANVATVDENGDVRAIGEGTATITTTLELTNTAVAENDPDYGKPYYIYKTTTVVVGSYSPVTEIILDPTNINLSVNGDTTSDTITATLMPEGTPGTVTWTIEPESVATITDNGDNTATVTAVSDGVATVTAKIGDVSATATVTVSDAPVVAEGGIAITSTSPDYFTITAYDVVSTVSGAEVQQMSAFAWSNNDQNDINAKVMDRVAGTNNWTITMPVNETPVNNYFDYADDIKINVYGSIEEGSNGDMIYANTYSWVNSQNIGNNTVAYIAYCQDIGFDMPTVFNGAEAGTTGENRQLEGVRISSGIEGLDIVTDIHVQDMGWLNGFEDGEYAGTMHKNLQAEAINLHLEGENAANYTLTYRVHGENYGWTDWVTAGTVAGTTNQALQLEAIEVQLIPNANN